MAPVRRSSRDRRSWSSDCVFDAVEHVSDEAHGPAGASAARELRDPGGGAGLLPRQRRAGRRGPRRPRLRGGAVGPVHHGRPGRPGHDRDPEARLHRPGSIFLDGKNVLSIVVEIDIGFLADWVLVGVVAETLTRGEFNVRIERVGRPEVKNMMLAPKDFDQVNRDLEIRDLYNMDDAFHLGESYAGAYRARLDANLAFWDAPTVGRTGPRGRTAAIRSPTWCSRTTWSSMSPGPTSSRGRSSRSSWPPGAVSRTSPAGDAR